MLIPIVIVVTSFITALRLITYRKCGESRYKLNVSLLAYAMIVCSGAQVIDVIFNERYITPWHAGLSTIIMILVLKAKGNVSNIIKGDNHVRPNKKVA